MENGKSITSKKSTTYGYFKRSISPENRSGIKSCGAHKRVRGRAASVNIRSVLFDTNPQANKADLAVMERRLDQKVKVIVAQNEDMDSSLMENLFWYSLNLTQPKTEKVDRVIFHAEMSLTFGINKEYMVDRIYDISRGKEETMSLQQYCSLLSIFFSNNPVKKADYCFRIYDADDDGTITVTEVSRHLRSAMPTFLSEDDEFDEDAHRELVDILMRMLDHLGCGSFNRESFRAVVKKRPEILECLGQTLPNAYMLQKFMDEYIDPKKYGIIQTNSMARGRRDVLLRDIPKGAPQRLKGLYPISMDLNEGDVSRINSQTVQVVK